MPVETATYITDLNASYPAHSDGLNNDDAHARLIKSTIKATFPNFTSAALNSTQAAIDGAVTSLTSGVVLLGSHAYNGNSSGLNFPDAHTAEMHAGGQLVVSYKDDLSATFAGSVTTTGPLTGPGVVPVGGVIMWLSDTLPTVGTWCWANGGTLPRTGVGAALYAMYSTRFGAGDGVTTFNVPNLQETCPVGKSTMGGAASPGLLNSIGSNKAVMGSLFGLDTTTLTLLQLPTGITSANTAAIPIAISSDQSNIPNQNSPSSTGGNYLLANTGPYYTIGSLVQWLISKITATANLAIGAVSVSSNNTSGQAHSNVQPSTPIGFIIRVA